MHAVYLAVCSSTGGLQVLAQMPMPRLQAASRTHSAIAYTWAGMRSPSSVGPRRGRVLAVFALCCLRVAAATPVYREELDVTDVLGVERLAGVRSGRRP